VEGLFLSVYRKILRDNAFRKFLTHVVGRAFLLLTEKHLKE